SVCRRDDHEQFRFRFAEPDRKIAQREAVCSDASRPIAVDRASKPNERPCSLLPQRVGFEKSTRGASRLDCVEQSRRKAVAVGAVAQQHCPAVGASWFCPLRRFGGQEDRLVGSRVDYSRVDLRETSARAFRRPALGVESYFPVLAFILCQPQGEITEERRSGLDRNDQSTRGAFLGEARQAVSVHGQPREPASTDNEIETAIRKRFEIAAEF